MNVVLVAVAKAACENLANQIASKIEDQVVTTLFSVTWNHPHDDGYTYGRQVETGYGADGIMVGYRYRDVVGIGDPNTGEVVIVQWGQFSQWREARGRKTPLRGE